MAGVVFFLVGTPIKMSSASGRLLQRRFGLDPTGKSNVTLIREGTEVRGPRLDSARTALDGIVGEARDLAEKS